MIQQWVAIYLVTLGRPAHHDGVCLPVTRGISKYINQHLSACSGRCHL